MSETSAATSTAKVVDGHFASWNQTDPDLGRELIASTWTDDASYVDPLFEAAGATTLDEMVAAVHERYSEHRFRLTAPVEAHHEGARSGSGWACQASRRSQQASTSHCSPRTGAYARSPASSSGRRIEDHDRAAAPAPGGELLGSWREQRRLSQLALAIEAESRRGISASSARAAPSRAATC